jgi:hypothetical protein
MLHNISSTTADAPSMTIQGHSVEKIGSASRNPSYLKLTGLEAALFCAPHASPSTRLGSDLHPAPAGPASPRASAPIMPGRVVAACVRRTEVPDGDGSSACNPDTAAAIFAMSPEGKRSPKLCA